MSVPQPLFHRNFGTGARRVLALHCTIAHSGAWRGLSVAMPEVTLVCPDMLSHGRSPDWDRQGDIQDRSADAVAGLLDAPMDVVGHSFGATVALRLAVAYPDRVRSLTMIEPVFFAVAMADDPSVVAEHEADSAPFAQAMAAGDEERGARLFTESWGNSGGPGWDEMPEKTRAAMVRGIHIVPAGRANLFDDKAGLLRPGVLDAVTMPVLMLRGADSPRAMTVINDGLARRLPDAESRAVDGAGHMVPLTHPDDVARELRRLFQRAQ